MIAEVMVDKVSLGVETPVDGVNTCLVEEEGTVKLGRRCPMLTGFRRPLAFG